VEAVTPPVERRQAVRSATLLGAGEALRQSCGAARSPADELSCRRSIANLRSAFDLARLEAAWAAGRALDMAGAISYARRTSGHTGQRGQTREQAYGRGDPGSDTAVSWQRTGLRKWTPTRGTVRMISHPLVPTSEPAPRTPGRG